MEPEWMKLSEDEAYSQYLVVEYNDGKESLKDDGRSRNHYEVLYKSDKDDEYKEEEMEFVIP
jgi:hypothetical protein